MSFLLSFPSLGAQPCIRPGLCIKPKELLCLANPGDGFKVILRSWIALGKCLRSRHVHISDVPTLDSKQSCSPSPLELSPLLALQQHLHNILTRSHPLFLKPGFRNSARLCHFQATPGASSQGWGDTPASPPASREVAAFPVPISCCLSPTSLAAGGCSTQLGSQTTIPPWLLFSQVLD